MKKYEIVERMRELRYVDRMNIERGELYDNKKIIQM